MSERKESVTATDLRIITAEILDQVRTDNLPVGITRQGKTVAYIVPVKRCECGKVLL